MRTIKSVGLLVVVFFVAITVGSVAGSDVYAAGPKNYKVTVRNPTGIYAFVNVYCLEGDTLKAMGEVRIIPQGSHTWQLGNKCPSYIGGRAVVTRIKIKLRTMDCLGNDNYSIRRPQTKCCNDISAKIYPRRDSQGSPQDDDYGFCKE